LKPKFAQVPEQSDFTYGVYLVVQSTFNVRVVASQRIAKKGQIGTGCVLVMKRVGPSCVLLQAAVLRCGVAVCWPVQDIVLL